MSGFSTSGRFHTEAGMALERVVVTLVVLAAVLCGAAMPTGCAATGKARKAADEAGRINRGHELDAALPQQAREIAQDAADAFEALEYLLGGDAPSAEAQGRINARRKARGEAPLEFK